MAVRTRILALVNKHLPGITIYDAETAERQLCLRVETIAPHEIALSRDGRSAYVPIYGSSGVGKPGTDEHTLHIFDTRTGIETGVLDTAPFHRLHSVAVGRSGRLYITAEISSAVVIVDPLALLVLGYIPTGSSNSHMIALDDDETTLFVSNVWSESISILDLDTRTLRQQIPTEGPNQRITVTPDQNVVVTSLGPAQKVVGYSRASHQIAFEVALDGHPFTAKVTPDGTRIYIVGTREGETCVWKIDLHGRRVAGAVYGLGGEPGSLEIDPASGNIYVTDQPTRKLLVLDPDSLSIIQSIETEPSPDAMAFGNID